MKTDLKSQKKSPCSTMNMAVPEYITCPRCGGEIELWSDENETICFFCNHRAFKKERIVH